MSIKQDLIRWLENLNISILRFQNPIIISLIILAFFIIINILVSELIPKVSDYIDFILFSFLTIVIIVFLTWISNIFLEKTYFKEFINPNNRFFKRYAIFLLIFIYILVSIILMVSYDKLSPELESKIRSITIFNETLRMFVNS